jgi:dTDP-4-amino-4,6-dideoxy-D-galactose acyltransferase
MQCSAIAPLCRFLPWDSEFFGVRIARLERDRITPAEMADALSWCAAERIRCLYFLASAESPETTRLAEDNGFRLTDIRVTLERKLDGGSPASTASIRASRESDIPALAAIAARSHRDSRFYYDGNFPAGHCDALYETWIERSCRGYADAVFVAEHDSAPAGYISCHVAAGGTGSIGLVAVGEQARGLGLGQQLVAAALAFFQDRRCARATVVTQARNCAAQRIYQHCGFRTTSIGIWYHRWFPPEPPTP